MKATHIRDTDKLGLKPSSRIDGCLQHHLPAFRCPTCGKLAYDISAEFPALRAPEAIADITGQENAVATMEEYHKTRAELLRYNDTSADVQPGSPFGPFVGTIQSDQLRKDFDFLFVGSTPLIKRSSAAKLSEAGISMTLGPATLHHKRQHVLTQYAAIQVEMEPLMSERTLNEMSLRQCPTCGIFRKTDPFARTSEYWHLIRAQWPKDMTLARVREFSSYIICSDQFIIAVQSLGLTGIAFEEIGGWI